MRVGAGWRFFSPALKETSESDCGDNGFCGGKKLPEHRQTFYYGTDKWTLNFHRNEPVPSNSRWISISTPAAHANGCRDVCLPAQCIWCWKADIWSLLVKHQWHAETMTLASTSHPGLDFATQEDIWPYRESILVVTSWRHVAPGIWWVEVRHGIKHSTVHSEAPHQKKWYLLKMSAVS